MNKRYTIPLLLLFSISVSIFSQNNLVPSLTLYDLTIEKMNSTHTDSKGNTVTITTNEPTNTSWGSFEYKSDLSENPLDCAGESPSGLLPPAGPDYSRIMLVGGTDKPSRSPYFILDFGRSETGIREIQLMGKATGTTEGAEGELLYAFSPISGARPAYTNAGDFEDLPDGYSPLVFKTGDCNYNNLRLRLPSGTVSVIIIAIEDFAGWSMSQSGFPNTPAIHAIRFYAEDNSTDIYDGGASVGDGISIIKEGDLLHTDKVCDLEVLDLWGRRVISARNTDILELGTVPRGVYLVRASDSRTGQVSQTKVVF